MTRPQKILNLLSHRSNSGKREHDNYTDDYGLPQVTEMLNS